MQLQKRLAAEILNCSPDRVHFETDAASLAKIKEGITRFDVKKLISQGYITKKQINGTARGRSKDQKSQKRKGRARGFGSRKGTAKARMDPKAMWVARSRVERALIKRMLTGELITKDTYKDLYRKIKGGFFRNARHIKIYLDEQNLVRKNAS